VAHAGLQPDWTRYLGRAAHPQRPLRSAYTYVIYGMVLSYTLTVIGMFSAALEASRDSASLPLHGISVATRDLRVVGTAWTLNTIITRPTEAFWGTAIVLVGVPGISVIGNEATGKAAGSGVEDV